MFQNQFFLKKESSIKRKFSVVDFSVSEKRSITPMKHDEPVIELASYTHKQKIIALMGTAITESDSGDIKTTDKKQESRQVSHRKV